MTRPVVKLVGEIATNHNGELVNAMSMVEHLHAAGFWAVKGQYRTPREEWKTRDYRQVDYAFGDNYFDHREAVDLTVEEHLELAEFCRSKGMEYYVSVWDVEGVEVARSISEWIKIPSALNNDLDILEAVVNSGALAIMSIGMLDELALGVSLATLGDALEYLLVTTCSYPAEIADLNLARITTLRQAAGTVTGAYAGSFQVGLSGHHLGPSADIVAVGLGAVMIERHVTLDPRLKGPDHHMSLDPGECMDLSSMVDNAVKTLGDPGIKLLGAESKFAKKVGRL